MVVSCLSVCVHVIAFMFKFIGLMCVRVGFRFFFFKQKAAYEMRISDWSSDVCSSDLQCDQLDRQRRGQKGQNELYPEDDAVMALRRVAGEHHEIGRASCRERVCQYV